MKIEDQVVSSDLARKMKELGAPQDSVLYWTWAEWNGKTIWVLELQEVITTLKKEYFSAYTVAELGEMLPGEICEIIGARKQNLYYLDCGKVDVEHSYYVRYIRHSTHDTIHKTHGSTEADARAKMWIYLKKEGLI